MKAGRASALSASLPQARPYCHSWAIVRFIRPTLPFCQGPRGLVYLCLISPALEERVELAGAVGGAVVGHHALVDFQ